MYSFINTMPLRKKINKGRTYLRLGLANVMRVFFYRAAIRSRIFQRLMVTPSVAIASEPLFKLYDLPDSLMSSSTAMIEEADDLLRGTFRCFSHRSHYYGKPPDWFLNPFNQKHYSLMDLHWSALGDFTDNAGDIKCIWEISRFDWVLVLVCAFRQTGKKIYISTANNWISDWCEKNYLYRGPNWKCGQEVGVRMMQVLLALFILEQHVRPTDGVVRFIIDHADRISPTIYYATGQDNNHGTSEAAALFVAGSWLLTLDSELVDHRKARRWKQRGRKWLENRIDRLVGDDGSFSQYSVNYHRVLLDTICYVEFWRELLHEQLFTEGFYKKARVATKWLFTFTDAKNGNAPNIGANDGAHLFNLGAGGYRDYRPSIQLASRLFMKKPAYPPGGYDENLGWLGLRFSDAAYKSLSMEKKSRIFDDGGYCYLISGKTEVFVRYPVYRFRPGHADALHVDLWYEGINIIRDAGTYSYNSEEKWMNYFSGTQAHSTVEFDGCDQMERVSRFLFANWLKVNHVSMIQRTTTDGITWSAGYKDVAGTEHRRQLFVSDNRICIKDIVKGFRKAAVVRWRLNPVRWTLDKCICSSDIAAIKVSSTCPNPIVKMVTGYESMYYLERSSIPVLTIEVNEECEVLTEIELQATGQMEKES